MAQIADSVSRAHGFSHLFAPRRLTLRGQSKPAAPVPAPASPGFLRPDTDSGVAANGPSMAQCSSIGIHADCPPRISARTQPSPMSRSAVFMPSRYKSASALLPHWIAR
uniref:Uncharacterized protein n=1 Tax=Pseudomonas viridiflava TaxID=33069 RepID=Q3T7R6_PSEVI|nr:hypothetical protein [Pseudomonas viridiflava]AAT96309.1 hypothetical protein [Pseudomonas viridiflava]